MDKSVPRYKGESEYKRKKWLYRQIGGCHILAHTAVTSWEVLTIDADVLDASMMSDPAIADLTALEIQDAFRCGVSGIYGEFYGINPKTLFGFLKSYLASDKKQQAHRIIISRQSREEKAGAERIYEAIQEAKRNGTFTPTWGPDYKFTDKVDSADHKEKIKRQAEEIYRQKR